MAGCPHNPSDIKFVNEGFWNAKVRCDNCGEVFDVHGWGRRGVGGAFLNGLTSGVSGLIGAEIRDRKD